MNELGVKPLPKGLVISIRLKVTKTSPVGFRNEEKIMSMYLKIITFMRKYIRTAF